MDSAIEADTRAVLRCRAITKYWSHGAGQLPALDAVDLTLRAGEIRVLLGENGAGKSTLVKVASGLVTPDAGTVTVRDSPLALGSVQAAQAAGIILIHQEPRLFGDLDVVDNMFIGAMPRGRFGTDRRSAARRAKAVLDEVGCAVPLDLPVHTLSVADQQLVDIAAALLRDPRVLIVDEPTASLTPVEVERLFGILRRLRDKGVAIAFIGHRLEEIMAISDTVTVLRDGRVVADLATAGTTEGELVRLMVGRDNVRATRAPAEVGEVLLAVSHLSSPGSFDDVNFEVRTGEIVALAGLVGAGRSEIVEAVFGIRPRSAGAVRMGGVDIRTPQQSVRAGLALVPEDRGRHGLVLSQSISDNVSATIIRRLSSLGVRRRPAERDVAIRAIRQFAVACRGPAQRVGELSGGNQQKVSVARWMVAQPRLLIIDEPTRGVDIAAKAEIHRLLGDLAASGMAVLMVSSELPEVLALADRVLVVREGRVAGELAAREATEESVLGLATGVTDRSAA